MIHWRCPKDIFGYCKGEPVWGKRPTPKYYENDGYVMAGTCQLDNKTCGRFQTVTEHYAGFKAPPSNYQHVTIGRKPKRKVSDGRASKKAAK